MTPEDQHLIEQSNEAARHNMQAAHDLTMAGNSGLVEVAVFAGIAFVVILTVLLARYLDHRQASRVSR